MEKINITFQPLTEEYLPLLTEWLNRPHMQLWWRNEKTDINKVREKYIPRIFDTDTAKPFLFFINEIPYGYIQYYSISNGNPNWWPDKPGEGVFGSDQFIADEENLNKGIGTKMITEFIIYLQKIVDVKEVRVDPSPTNLRAIKCYEKVGFVNKGLIENPDGKAFMMVLKL